MPTDFDSVDCKFESCYPSQSRQSDTENGDSVRITPVAVNRCIGRRVLIPTDSETDRGALYRIRARMLTRMR